MNYIQTLLLNPSLQIELSLRHPYDKPYINTTHQHFMRRPEGHNVRIIEIYKFF